MIKPVDKSKSRSRRHRRIRGKMFGTSSRPRLCVFRSLNHIYAQIIDDSNGVTLVSASSVEKSFTFRGGNKSGACELGKIISLRALEKGITNVVFDRNGYLYHGRVKELAESARKSGLVF